MNHETRQQVTQRATERRTKISDQKNIEYTIQDEDSLANFKKIGTMLGVDAVMVCSIYMQKHLDSIATFIRKYVDEPDAFKRRDLVEEGEGIISRIDDARNYMDIFECLLWDAGVHPDSTQETMPEIMRNPCKDIELPDYRRDVETRGSVEFDPYFIRTQADVDLLKQKGYDVT